jgi:hypothetical protein
MRSPKVSLLDQWVSDEVSSVTVEVSIRMLPESLAENPNKRRCERRRRLNDELAKFSGLSAVSNTEFSLQRFTQTSFLGFPAGVTSPPGIALSDESGRSVSDENGRPVHGGVNE